MVQFRCKKCNALLCMEHVIEGVIEIKCYNCNELNRLEVSGNKKLSWKPTKSKK